MLRIMLTMTVALALTVPALAQVPTRDVPGSPGSRGSGGGTRNSDVLLGGGGGGPTASWQLCNLSGQDRINAVAVWSDGTAWRSTGWLPIARSKCIAAPRMPTDTAYYFAVGSGKSWSGQSSFCLSPSTAQARLGSSCQGDEKAVGFRKVTLRGSLVNTNFR